MLIKKKKIVDYDDKKIWNQQFFNFPLNINHELFYFIYFIEKHLEINIITCILKRFYNYLESINKISLFKERKKKCVFVFEK